MLCGLLRLGLLDGRREPRDCQCGFQVAAPRRRGGAAAAVTAAARLAAAPALVAAPMWEVALVRAAKRPPWLLAWRGGGDRAARFPARLPGAAAPLLWARPRREQQLLLLQRRALAVSAGGEARGEGPALGAADRERIQREFAGSQDSPAVRRMTLEAKLRMLRFLDKVYDEQTKKDSELHSRFAQSPIASRRQVSFEEFLQADANGDGRVSSAEWERFLQKKALSEKGVSVRAPSALNVEIPLSHEQLHMLAGEFEGLHISINGMRYRLSLTPEGGTAEVIAEKTAELSKVLTELARLELIKRPLDAKAARHTKRVLTIALVYLLAQAGVIAKLTFFSRFGWDVMEPITYFLTFGTAILGLAFFQFHKIEYSYPSLAAMVTQRKAAQVYRKHGFDIGRHTDLQHLAVRLEKQLQVLEPPRSMLMDRESMDKVDAMREQRRQQMQAAGIKEGAPGAEGEADATNKKRDGLYSAGDAY
jgi:hypothetical protein